MNPRRISFLMLSAAALLPLAACQTTNTTAQGTTTQRVESALNRAADDAATQGNSRESLAFLERLYKRDSGNPQNALKYAVALRENGRLNRASLILSPFVEDGKAAKDSALSSEFATIQAELGNYAEAEKHARAAVLAAPESGQAYHVLGIALDAQGHHPQAEVAFRKALEHWQGDPVPVLNNLGLNLASQGFIDQAIETLRKAAAAAPGRADIERNLRIVTALQGISPPQPAGAAAPPPPTPARKPGHNAAVIAPAPATKSAGASAGAGTPG